jgi:hypothetical protein
MAKGDSKVLNDEDEYSFDDLVELINGFDYFMRKEREKFKELKKRHTSLQDSYEELKMAHEGLKETNEMLKESHDSLIAHETNKTKVDMSISCKILDDESTISHISSSTSHNDVFTSPNDVSCNDVLIVNENIMLKEKVEKLTNDLARRYIRCRGGSWHPGDRACIVNRLKMHQDW